MPLRGKLFERLTKTKNQRIKIEEKRRIEDVKRGAKALKRLRKTRIQEEGTAALRKAIAGEKARIKAAKGKGTIGKIEGFLAKETRKALTGGTKKAKKELRKQTKEILSQKGARKPRKRRTKRKKQQGAFDIF